MFPRLVLKRSWSLFNLLKSLSIRIYFSKLYIRIFGDNKFIFCTNIINIIISWLWVILIRLFLLNKINSFTSHTIFNIIFELFLTLILNKIQNTFPGPGIFCICGTRYDLSGELYRLSPKDLPFYLFI
jgi:hypothetical protein